MHRRALLGAVATGAVAAAGCTGILGDGADEEDGGPAAAEVVRQFWEHVADGDPAAANELLHPDTSRDPATQEGADHVAEMNTTIEHVEVVDQSGDRATVAVTFREYPGSESGGITYTVDDHVRRHEGEWRMADEPPQDPETVTPPNTQWEVTQRTGEDGSVTAVEFEFSRGDAVAIDEFGVHVGGTLLEGEDPEGHVSPGSVIAVEFDGDGDSVDAGESIDLVWTFDESTMASHVLSVRTAGGPTLTFDA